MLLRGQLIRLVRSHGALSSESTSSPNDRFRMQALVIFELCRHGLSEDDRPHPTYIILQYHEEVEHYDKDNAVDAERNEIVLPNVT